MFSGTMKLLYLADHGQRSQTSRLRANFTACERHLSKLELKERRGPRELTVQGGPQGADPPHSPEPPSTSGRRDVELGDLWGPDTLLSQPFPVSQHTRLPCLIRAAPVFHIHLVASVSPTSRPFQETSS